MIPPPSTNTCRNALLPPLCVSKSAASWHSEPAASRLDDTAPSETLSTGFCEGKRQAMPTHLMQSVRQSAARRCGLLLALALVASPSSSSPGETPRRSQFAQHLTGRLIAGEGTVLHETAQWGDDVTLGANVIVGVDVRFGSWILVGDDSVIGSSVVIGSGVVLGSKVTLGAGTTIGPDAKLGNGTSVGAGAVIGAGVSVGESVVISAGAHLRENASVPDHGFVSLESDLPVLEAN